MDPRVWLSSADEWQVGARACFVCGRADAAVAYSHHWREWTCVACLCGTMGEPVGYLCERRLASGRLCQRPAMARRLCAVHAGLSSDPRVQSAFRRARRSAGGEPAPAPAPATSRHVQAALL